MPAFAIASKLIPLMSTWQPVNSKQNASSTLHSSIVKLRLKALIASISFLMFFSLEIDFAAVAESWMKHLNFLCAFGSMPLNSFCEPIKIYLNTVQNLPLCQPKAEDEINNKVQN